MVGGLPDFLAASVGSAAGVWGSGLHSCTLSTTVAAVPQPAAADGGVLVHATAVAECLQSCMGGLCCAPALLLCAVLCCDT